MTSAKDKPGRHDRMVAAYGFGLFPLPRYREAQGKSGGKGWAVRHHLPSMSEGYLTQSFVEGNRFVLYEGRVPWMSTGLFEVESHAWHVHCASGLVVVAGLGLGMYASAIARKPDVTQVIVIERDPRVPEILESAADLANWPGREKIQILMADALDETLADQVALFTGGQPADYLYVDIWPVTPDETAPGQFRAMAERLKPRQCGWWGQEFNFGAWCLQQGRPVDAQSASEYFDGLPVPMTDGYLAFCADLAKANHRYLTRPAAVEPEGFWSWLLAGLRRSK